MRTLRDLVVQWRSYSCRPVRLVVFGSSNTEIGEGNFGRFNWSCWLEIALRSHVGKHLTMTNSGICGQTVDDLLMRVHRDIITVHPDAAIITIGGNDRWLMTPEQYACQLEKLVRQVAAAGILPILHTYYSLLSEDENQSIDMLSPYMDFIRKIAKELGVPCIDNYPLMHAWHKRRPQEYRRIMLDPGHLNGIGHAIFGTLCIRTWGMMPPAMPPDIATDVAEALACIAAASNQ